MCDLRGQLSQDYERLTDEISRRARHTGIYFSSLPGLRFIRRDDPSRLENVLFPPSICLVAQGLKRASIGTEPYEYGRGNFLLSCVEMPGAMRVCVEKGKPYLALAVELDIPLLSRIFDEMDGAASSAMPEGGEVMPEALPEQEEALASGSPMQVGPAGSVRIGEVTPEMLNAFLRLACIADDKDKVRFVAPLILREIHYYLASGPFGEYLRSFYACSSQSRQIARALSYMREHCSERLRIEHLARMVNMAESTFNRNFKKVTSLSPLQYHKHLKLYEARRLMLTEEMSAAAACFAVGYESQQQFTREYKRLFGNPPMKDVRQNS